MAPQRYFVTGTDTDVGKTMVSSLLCYGLGQSGSVIYWKPVQSGTAARDCDVIKQNAPATAIAPSRYEYQPPMSPDQAALVDDLPQAQIEPLIQALDELPAATFQVIEGAGGLQVPLNNEWQTWSDFLGLCPVPVIVVARSGLGTLNHTSMTIDSLKLRGLPPVLVVLSGEPHQPNLDSLKRRYPDLRFFQLPILEATPKNPAWHDWGIRFAQQVLATNTPLPSQSMPTEQRDAINIWHPFTQHKTAPRSLEIISAKGCYLKDATGRKLFDATASWWVNTIGHGREDIGAVMHKQQLRMDHVIFAGTCHEPAATLASHLIADAQGHLARVFFSDNGSTAVEIALKMAVQFHHNRGKPRSRILTLAGAYHGDTIGAMSASQHEGFYHMFKPLMFPVTALKPITSHASSFCPAGPSPELIAAELDLLDQTLAKHPGEWAAIILEPFVQGAGGMLMQDRSWLQAVCQKMHEAGILVIFDEVFVGMGRIGHKYAYQREGLKPDIVCLAKGLTGGTMPLAVTVTTADVFAGFWDDDRGKALFHGHSFTGNPIACAAANQVQKIYAEQNLCDRAYQIEAIFSQWLQDFAAPLGLQNSRCLGAILAFEIPGSAFGDYFHDGAYKIMAQACDYGLFLRPLGNTLYLVPPLVVTDEELGDCLERLKDFCLDVLSR